MTLYDQDDDVEEIMDVPEDKVGSVIGEKGARIREIKKANQLLYVNAAQSASDSNGRFP